MRLRRRGLALLAAVGLMASLVLAATRLDLIRVTEPLDLAETSASGGVSYRNPIPTLYAPFFHVVAPEAKAMRVMIDGTWYACTADRVDAALQGGGTCAFDNTYLTWSRPDNADPRTIGRPVFVSYPVRGTPELLFATLLLSAAFGLGALFATTARRLAGFVGLLLLVPSATLTGANLVGLVMPLRSPTLTERTGGYGPDDLRYSYEDAVRLIEWRDDDTPLSYATRTNDAIAGAVLHFWTVSAFRELRVIVPVWENWLLRALGQIRPEFTEYIFWNPRKAIERGVGLCGHVSSALVGLLRERGIDARIVTLFGHVVVTAEVKPGIWHIFDPDLGIAIPHDLSVLEQHADLVRHHYGRALRSIPLDPAVRQAFEDMLVNAYLDRGSNHVDPLGRESYHSGLRVFGLWHSELEPLLYRLKWTIPLGLMLLGGAIVATAVLWPRRATHRPADFAATPAAADITAR